MFLLLKTSNDRLIALILFYIFYLFFGAFVFDQLESPHEAKIIRELNRYVREFRERHDACLTDDELNEFIKLISIANDKGVPATRNVSKEQNWSFGQAVFFAGTVLTTIGYGDVTVQTQLGKVFCMIFALFGIPATLLLLYAVIERLMKLTSFMLAKFTDVFHPIFKSVSRLGDSIQRSHMHVIFALSCALFVLVFFFVIPASLYSKIEGWSYLNSFYYCFISLSTVGLGDYVPGDHVDQQHRHMYKILSTIYLIVGVTVMVWLLQIFSETPEFNFYKYFTLTKDGILTSHRDQNIHPAPSSNDAFILSGKSFGNVESSSGRVDSSKIIYQQQLDETTTIITSPSGSKNNYDPLNSTPISSNSTTNNNNNVNDDTSLNISTNNHGHNYMSLASIKQSSQQ
jgi:potassium channel subfamily K protein 1